jgi:hypothetical protein
VGIIIESELLFFTVFLGDGVSSLDFCNIFCFRVKLDVTPEERGNNDDDDVKEDPISCRFMFMYFVLTLREEKRYYRKNEEKDQQITEGI